MARSDIKSNLFNELRNNGFELETVSSGYTKVFHPNYPEHIAIAIVETNGSISLSTEIASQFDQKRARKKRNVGRFPYTWTGAESLSDEEIAQTLERAVFLSAEKIAQKLDEKKTLKDKKWYALHVYSGQENKVMMYLQNEIKQAGLEDRIGQILVPQENVVEMKDGKKVVKTKNFFPGYVLAEMVLDKETRHLVLNSPGVINFLGSKNSPQTIHPSEIERILGRTREKEEKESLAVPFNVGDTVKVIDGPFNDFFGFIEEVNPEKNRVKVMVSIFGRPTPVELDFLQVEREK